MAESFASNGQVWWNSSGAGVWKYQGLYYIPNVGHMVRSLGAMKAEGALTGAGNFGRISHTTAQNVDIGLIATGTKAIAPRIMVWRAWQDAYITDVAHATEVTTDTKAGMQVCHNGATTIRDVAGGYRCGTVAFDCFRTESQCGVENLAGIVSPSDSGGPVWGYSAAGIKLLGWVSARGGTWLESASPPSYTLMLFTPVWVLQDHSWKAEETWLEGGYPAGNDGTGCFVTAHGCVKS